MPLPPVLRALIEGAATAPPPPTDPVARVAAMRAGLEVFATIGAREPRPVAAVVDRLLDGPHGPLPVRTYHPLPPASSDGAGPAAPVVVFLHGGGFVTGTLDSHDRLCRRLAAESEAVVVSVDYRLAPEHPFPQGLDDCVFAATWAHEHAGELGADPARLAVAGDSAGGNLAAATCLRARVAGPPIAAQVLVYPVIDAACDTASYVENGVGCLLTADQMRFFWDAYLGPDGDPHDAYASVLRAPDLSGLPPALIVTAALDPLRDEGEAYARRLDGFDVPVRLRQVPDVIHGFLGMDAALPEAAAVMAEIAAFLREALAAPA